MNTSNSKLHLPEDPFEGTFKDLLKLLPTYPGLVEPSKARFTRLALRQGIVPVRSAAIQRIYGTDTLVAHKAFANFFGVEQYVQAIMTDYFGAAMAGHEADKQALALIGPPGAGKSDLVEQMKRICRTAEPVPFNEGCPVHDNPLSLLYMVHRLAHFRAKGKVSAARAERVKIIAGFGVVSYIDWDSGAVKEILAKYDAEATAEGVASITDPDDFVSLVIYGLGLPKVTRNSIGMPCPYCQDRLFGEFDKEKQVELADFPMDNLHFSLGQGIVDVPEVQPLNFDIKTWVGSRNLGKMGRLDSRDPRGVELNGYFNRANRGVIVITEGLKNPPEAQRVLLEALQGRRIALPEPLSSFHEKGLHWEGLIIIHSNEGEYNKFKADIVNEPYWDRFLRILFKYPLEASEAARITRKLWNSSDFSKPQEKGGVHLEPLLADYEGRFRVLSYQEEDPNGVPPMVKLNAYDGRQVRERGMGTVVDVADLRNRATWREGMEGFSPRETSKVLGAMAAQALHLLREGKVNHACVTTRDFREKMISVMKVNISDKKKLERYIGFLSTELEDYRRVQLSRVVRSAFIEEFGGECQNLFDKYVEWSNAAVLGTTPKARSGFQRVSQYDMEQFLREVESDPEWGVVSAQAPKFRQEVQAAVSEHMREHGTSKVPYTVHEGIKNCIERFVLKQVKDVARLFNTSTSASEEDRRKVEGAKGRLISQHGFCPHCAEQLLVEVSMTRGFLKE